MGKPGYIGGMVFTIGSYLPGDSILHRFDPRLKLISLLLITVTVLLVKSFPAYLFMLLVISIAIVIVGVGLSLLLKQFKIWGWLLILTIVLHLWTTDGTPFVTVFGKNLTWGGLWQGLLFGTRFLIFILTAFLLTITTSPYELTRAFSALISPLRYLRAPVDDLAMVIGIAFRFIPVIFNEAVEIKFAQESRGVDFSNVNILKPRKLIPLLIPLFYSIFRKADDLTDALISRNYRPGAKRTSLRSGNITLLDLSLSLVIIITCLSLILLA